MKKRSFILRFAAFLLLLIFTQKMGGSLLLHNLLHISANVPAKQSDNSNKEIKYACNCIDDFLMPFVEADEPVISSVVTVSIVVNTFLPESVSFPSHSFISQRGPPAGRL
ncbi:MAG: hypothetical protein ABIR18_08125 [Chitinophagaceae bacterium]